MKDQFNSGTGNQQRLQILNLYFLNQVRSQFLQVLPEKFPEVISNKLAFCQSCIFRKANSSSESVKTFSPGESKASATCCLVMSSSFLCSMVSGLKYTIAKSAASMLFLYCGRNSFFNELKVCN